MTIGLTLLAAFAVGAPAQTQGDWTLNKGIDWVLQRRRLSEARSEAMHEVLLQLAGERPSLANRFRFVAYAANVLAASQKADGDLFTSISGGQQSVALKSIAQMAEVFEGDGSLSRDRYTWPSKHDAGWLTKVQDTCEDSVGVQALLDAYGTRRSQGDSPHVAFAWLYENRKHYEAGVDTIGAAILELGTGLETGYDDRDQERDFVGFLEARYAAYHPHAKDTVGVVPDKTLVAYFGHRFENLLRQDVATEILPIDNLIDKVLAEGSHAPAHPANPTPLGSSPLPGFDHMGDSIDPANLADLGQVVCQVGFRSCECDFKNPFETDTKQTRLIFSGEKEQALAWIDSCWMKQSTAYGASIQANKVYDLVLDPWYSAASEGAGVFCVLPSTGSQPTRAEAEGKEGVRMPSSPGEPIEVRIRIRTDQSGRFRVAFVPLRPCEITFGRFWLRPVSR